jgi:hypothetical protein
MPGVGVGVGAGITIALVLVLIVEVYLSRFVVETALARVRSGAAGRATAVEGLAALLVVSAVSRARFVSQCVGSCS